MEQPSPPGQGPEPTPIRVPERFGWFEPVPLRYRHDGWVPERQRAFIENLAICGCVDEAAASVGMSRQAAYDLRNRPDAQAFRLAWEAAMEVAIGPVGDGAISRSIKGVAVPIFHNGVQVGERRHFDERLTMFILRHRDPRYADRRGHERPQPSDRPAVVLAYRIGRMLRTAWHALETVMRGEPHPDPEPEPIALDRLPEDGGEGR